MTVVKGRIELPTFGFSVLLASFLRVLPGPFLPVAVADSRDRRPGAHPPVPTDPGEHAIRM
ncbi:MAG: hypothetical protein ACE5MI_10625 [Acidimicrobiia bacterium]